MKSGLLLWGQSNNAFFSTFGIVFALSFIIIISVMVFMVKNIIEFFKRKKTIEYFTSSIIDGFMAAKYVDVSKAKLDEFHIDDLGSFKNSLYEEFEEFEKAYNSLDFNTMKQISTAQLYENYYTGISLNIKDGKKKVIDDLKRKKVVVYSINSTSTSQTVQTLMTISYLSYTIDNDGYIVSGNKEKPVTESFEVVFRKEYTKDNFSRCPNCGATVNGKKCEYCRTTIKDTEFKIAAIKKVITEKD